MSAYPSPNPDNDISQPIASVRTSPGMKLVQGGTDSKGRPTLTIAPDGSVDFTAVGDRAKQLHPEYASVDSQTLGQGIMRNAPEYGQLLASGKPIPASVRENPKLAADPVHMAIMGQQRPSGVTPQYEGDTPSTPAALSVVGRAGVAAAANVASQAQGIKDAFTKPTGTYNRQPDTAVQAKVRAIAQGLMHPSAFLTASGDYQGQPDSPAQSTIRTTANALNPINAVPTQRFKEGDVAGGVGELGSNALEMLLLHKAGTLIAPAKGLPAVASPEMSQAARIIQNTIKPLAGENVATGDIAKALESVRKFSGPQNMPQNPTVLAARIRAAAQGMKGSRAATLNKVADVVERSVAEQQGGSAGMPHLPGAGHVNLMRSIASAIPDAIRNSRIATAGRLAIGAPATPGEALLRRYMMQFAPVVASTPGQYPAQ